MQEDKLNKRRLQSSYLTSIISISLVLFMLGVLGFLILNAKKLSDYVKENIGFSVIMNDGVKESEIIRFQKTLDVKKFVKSTEYITKDEAAEMLTEDLGEDFIGFLGYNPLLPSIDIRLIASYANNDSLAVIEKQIIQNPDVKEVFYQESLVEFINDNLRKISIIILGFSVLLMLISFALINNTIRLTVYSKRFIIKTMLLVGATQGFVRRPLIRTGILHGVIGALIAILLLSGIVLLSRNGIPELINLDQIDTFAALFGIVLLLGVLLSWLSYHFAVRKYLRMKTDQLYY